MNFSFKFLNKKYQQKVRCKAYLNKSFLEIRVKISFDNI